MYRDDLIRLALLHGTDKWGTHWYAQHYATHFHPRRLQRLNVLEIGVGGHADPMKGGLSLRTWRDYFPYANIYGVDIHDKSALEGKRIKIFRGSQGDAEFLKQVFEQIGKLDIVIDDGSHFNEHVLTSFETLFPLLSDGGIYVIEDTQTSYWPAYGGSSEDTNRSDTILGFSKALIDSVNYMEIIRPGYVPSFLDKNIVSLHFYHNMVFIYKGANDERSNFLEANVWPERLSSRLQNVRT